MLSLEMIHLLCLSVVCQIFVKDVVNEVRLYSLEKFEILPLWIDLEMHTTQIRHGICLRTYS